MMKDILEQLEELKKEAELIDTEPEQEELIKEAAELTDGLVKTAEEAQVFYLGRIFGQGMAEGFLEKIAQAVAEAEPEIMAVPPAQEVPQQVPESAVDDDEFVQMVMQLKEIVQNMTPAEIIAWYESLSDEEKEVIHDDPELSSMVNEAYKMIAAPTKKPEQVPEGE